MYFWMRKRSNCKAQKRNQTNAESQPAGAELKLARVVSKFLKTGFATLQVTCAPYSQAVNIYCSHRGMNIFVRCAQRELPLFAFKNVVKQVNIHQDHAERLHWLRLKYSELLEGVNCQKSLSLLEQSSDRISTFATCLVGTTNTKSDLPDFNHNLDFPVQFNRVP